jgi:hypothetical protein
MEEHAVHFESSSQILSKFFFIQLLQLSDGCIILSMLIGNLPSYLTGHGLKEGIFFSFFLYLNINM